MSRQQQYHDDDQEAQYAAGQQQPPPPPAEGPYYDQEYDQRQDYDPRQSGRSDGYYQDYEEGRYSQQGGYYEGSDVGEGGAYYAQQREDYASSKTRAPTTTARILRRPVYPDAYPAGVDPMVRALPLIHGIHPLTCEVNNNTIKILAAPIERASAMAPRKTTRRAWPTYHALRHGSCRRNGHVPRRAILYGRSHRLPLSDGRSRGYGRPPSSQVSSGGNRSSQRQHPHLRHRLPRLRSQLSRALPRLDDRQSNPPLEGGSRNPFSWNCRLSFDSKWTASATCLRPHDNLIDSRASRMTPQSSPPLVARRLYRRQTRRNCKKCISLLNSMSTPCHRITNVKLGKTNKRTRRRAEQAAAKKARGGAGDEQTLEQLEG